MIPFKPLNKTSKRKVKKLQINMLAIMHLLVVVEEYAK